MLPPVAPLTGTHPTGRDATVPGFTSLVATYRRAGESEELRAYGYAQSGRVLSGAVMLDCAGTRRVIRAAESFTLPAQALHAVVPLEAGSCVRWEPCDDR